MNENAGTVRVRVPASTANLGPGFDTLGMSLSLYIWIEMRRSERTIVHFEGDGFEEIPADKRNLIYKVAQLVFETAGVEVPELEIGMRSDIPLTRGLGSSASAIIAGLVAANALIGYPLSNDRLFDLATGLEKHPDNVGASLFGGIVAAAWDGNHADYIRIEPPKNLQVLALIPDFELETSKARAVLPQQLSLQDAVYNISRSSLLTAALVSGRLDLLSSAMQDRLHQPYRAALVPGMERILAEAPERGALGAALSGAGPTLLALVDREGGRHAELESFMQDVMRENGIEARTLWLEPDLDGAVGETNAEPELLSERIKGEISS
ncbi:homoserine kinase [Saccharibacillus sp. CPCC 101409]|uniref:homoserine kinase n=1 Tax=Saccharibacillus sp. CPCC 101409 TaxID=3058041 RepID=UPI002671B233|nr:homoserine kinase [Saccharibacillus sp. CPCC 101409]MDO3410169.1 homoserine kinase [Saccharibacillus sp. CPCC 101409]